MNPEKIMPAASGRFFKQLARAAIFFPITQAVRQLSQASYPKTPAFNVYRQTRQCGKKTFIDAEILVPAAIQ